MATLGQDLRMSKLPVNLASREGRRTPVKSQLIRRLECLSLINQKVLSSLLYAMLLASLRQLNSQAWDNKHSGVRMSRGSRVSLASVVARVTLRVPVLRIEHGEARRLGADFKTCVRSKMILVMMIKLT